MDGSELLTTAEAGKLVNKSAVAMRQACERGSIPEAISKGGIWLIPRPAAIHYGKTAKRGRPPKNELPTSKTER